VSFGHTPPTWLVSVPEYFDYTRDLRSFKALAAYTLTEGNLATPDEPERVGLASVSSTFFSVLGVRPLVGRTFLPDEDRGMPATVVVLSYGLWQRRFGGDRTIVGRTIPFNGIPRTVVGVMPQYFDYPTAHVDVWLPMARFNSDSLGERTNHYLFMVGRLRRDVPVARAVSEANTVTRRLMRDYADRYDPNARSCDHAGERGARRCDATVRLDAVRRGRVRVHCVCERGNLLARRPASQMAVRAALGATRRRMLAQLLESTVFAWAAAVSILLMERHARSSRSLRYRSRESSRSTRLGGVALTTLLGAGILFGLVPHCARRARLQRTPSRRAGERRVRALASRASARGCGGGAGSRLAVRRGRTAAGVELQSADLGFDAVRADGESVAHVEHVRRIAIDRLYAQLWSAFVRFRESRLLGRPDGFR
jgi:hypothetical protein